MTLAMPELEGVRHRMVQAAGLSFHMAEAGPEDGVPILLVHGWPQHWFTWRRVISPLAAQRRVICIDLRGFGWSDAPPGAYAKRTLAEDIVALLDALGIDQVDLIAHDWGAWASYIVCLDHPERVRNYVALNMPSPWAKRSARGVLGIWRLWYQVVLATPGLGAFVLTRTPIVERMLTTGAVHPEAWDDGEAKLFSAPLREPARVRASQRLYRTFLTREMVPYALGRNTKKRLTVPTVMLHGTKDLAVDHRNLGDWERMGDSMALELRDDSGHFIAEELPDVVVSRARALFGRG